MFHISCVRCHISGFGCQVSGFGCQVSGVAYQVSCVRCPVLGVRFQVSHVRYHVSQVSCQMSDVTCQVSCVRCQGSHLKMKINYKVLELVGGRSLINWAYPSRFQGNQLIIIWVKRTRMDIMQNSVTFSSELKYTNFKTGRIKTKNI